MSWLNTNYILRAGVLYVLLLLSGLMSATCQTNAPEQTQHTRYDNRVHRFRRNWERIIPTHSKIQYAGNMGLLSFAQDGIMESVISGKRMYCSDSSRNILRRKQK